MEQDINDINKLEEVLSSEKDNELNLQDEINDVLIIDVDDEGEENTQQRTQWLINECADIDNFPQLNMLVDKQNLPIDINHVKNYLSSEELNIILQCKDEKLKTLMILNRSKCIQLKSLEVVINNLYSKCLNSNCVSITAPKKKRIKLGCPYFKTLNNNTCPPNLDVIKKQKAGEVWVDYLKKQTIWTRGDLIDLKRGIALSYYKYNIDKIQNKIIELKQSLDECQNVITKAGITEKIRAAEKQLSKREKEQLNSYPPLLFNEGIDWMHISAVDLKGKHSSTSCEALWNLFLHPSLHKSKWKANEYETLTQLCKKYGEQNWEAIVSELGTNRSPLAACIQYRSGLYSNLVIKYFTPEEDQKLLEVISKCKKGDFIPWRFVSSQFKDRTKNQLYARYKTTLKYNTNFNKGRFSKAEDVLLYCVIKLYGKNFQLCEDILKTRNQMQLRARYNNYINGFKSVQYGNWTLEEDKIILNYFDTHPYFSARKLRSVLNRNDSSIRHRLSVLQNWQLKNEGKPIEAMSRKTHYSHGYNQHLEEVPKLADQFLEKKVELTLENVEEMLATVSANKGRRIGSKKTFFGLPNDQKLIDYFKTVLLTKPRRQKFNEKICNDAANAILNYLHSLNIQLNIPDQYILKEMKDLDEMDLILLDKIRHRKLDTYLCEVDCFIPPNLDNLVGLRLLLLSFMKYKKEYSNTERWKNCARMEKYYESFTEEEENNYIKQKLCFVHRFNMIFAYASLMSIIKYDNSHSLTKSNDDELSKRSSLKGRPKKDLTKVKKMLLAKTNSRNGDENKTDLTRLLPPKVSYSIGESHFQFLKNNFDNNPKFTYGNRKRACKSISKSNKNVSTPNLQSSNFIKSDEQIVDEKIISNEQDEEIITSPATKKLKQDPASKPVCKLEIVQTASQQSQEESYLDASGSNKKSKSNRFKDELKTFIPENSEIVNSQIVDSHLIAYFKQFNNTKEVPDTRIGKDSENVSHILDVLNAKVNFTPENAVNNNPHLDTIDQSLLSIKREKNEMVDDKNALAPNRFSITALKVALQNFALHKNKYNETQRYQSILNIQKVLNKLDNVSKQDALFQMELFYIRLRKLFIWPFVMNWLHRENNSLKSVNNVEENEKVLKCEPSNASNSSNDELWERIDIKSELQDIDLLDAALNQNIC